MDKRECARGIERGKVRVRERERESKVKDGVCERWKIMRK
jgi:hypothetical protein